VTVLTVTPPVLTVTLPDEPVHDPEGSLMPTAPPRPCAQPGCPNLTTATRCPDHARAYATTKARSDQRTRGTRTQRGYSDRQHLPWAKTVKVKHPLCVGYPYGVHGASLVASHSADHIVPLALWVQNPTEAAGRLQRMLSERGEHAEHLDAWSLDNGQGLCQSCHARKSRNEMG
jgi:hypothetical protein